MQGPGKSHDINQGINRSEFFQFEGIGPFAMNLGLGLPEVLQDQQGIVLNPVGQATTVHQF